MALKTFVAASALSFLIIGTALVRAQEATPSAPEVSSQPGGTAPHEATPAQSSTSPKSQSTEQMIEGWLRENEVPARQVEKIKRKAREYQEVVERENVPKGAVRTVYPPLDGSEIEVQCMVNYSTIIRLPGAVTERDVIIGNAERFTVQLYGDGHTLVVIPRAAFKSTNVQLMCDGGNRIIHLLLHENANRKKVDYQVNVNWPESGGTVELSSLMSWIAYDSLPPGAEISGGLGARMSPMKKKLSRDGSLKVLRKLELHRPERLIGYALAVPAYQRDRVEMVGAAYWGELPTGELFAYWRTSNAKINYEGTIYELP